MKPVIEVERLSKFYSLDKIGATTIRDSFEAWWSRTFKTERPSKNGPLQKWTAHAMEHEPGPEPNSIWALKDISFSIQPGEIVGLLGDNGAGKSTLLKILSKITAPSAGHARLRGSLSLLSQFGTGFHPDLTGRENININGAILGMSQKEIDRKLDEIVEFSGIESFIDQPVKRYSSGMSVRLAFAIAVHLETEILLMDEALAVGDISFQAKCLKKIQNIGDGGRTILFVSHNITAIKSICHRALVFRAGKLVMDDAVENAVQTYLNIQKEDALMKERLRAPAI